MYHRAPLILCTAIFVLMFTAIAGSNGSIELVGTASFTNPALDVHVVDEHVYVLTGSPLSGYYLAILDISEPTNPTEIGHVSIPGNPHQVYVVDDHAYIAAGDAGVRVMDVSDPENPHEVGFHITPGEASGLCIAGKYAYVAVGEEGLRIIDVSEPTSVYEAEFYDIPGYSTDVYIVKDRVYVTAIVSEQSSLHSHLFILDVSDPDNPRDTIILNMVVGSGDYAWEGEIRYISQEYAYVTGTTIRMISPGYFEITPCLQVIDISDLNNPYMVADYLCHAYQGDHIWVAGNYIYVVISSGKLLVKDISDLQNPRFLELYEGLHNGPSAIYVDHDDIYITYSYEGESGLHILEHVDPSCYTKCDVNRDDIVDIIDIILVARHFGESISTPVDPDPDVNGDGIVDTQDIVLVGQHFGETYPQGAPSQGSVGY